jgi:Protein of unknown function (DUF1697)
MAVIVAMLRGVNVGGHNRVPMEELRKLCAPLKLREAQTYVQSGNVIFTTEEKDFVALAKRMERAIQKKFGVRTDVVLRSAAELREVVARNPFAERRGIVPGKLLVTFLGGDPGKRRELRRGRFGARRMSCLSMGGRRICTSRMVWGGRRCHGRRFQGPGEIGIALRRCWRWRRSWNRRLKQTNPCQSGAGWLAFAGYRCRCTPGVFGDLFEELSAVDGF